ncbi:MAG: hypothetical protein ACFFBD_01520 [Candidatus Hodarchaeota archaeon]
MNNPISVGSPNCDSQEKEKNFWQMITEQSPEDSVREEDLYEYGNRQTNVGMLRGQIREEMFGHHGSVMRPRNAMVPEYWNRICRLHSQDRKDIIHIKRFFQLVRPFYAVFPPMVLEAVVQQMLQSPEHIHRLEEVGYLQVLAFIESYLRSRGLTITASTLLELNSILSTPVNQTTVYKVYYRLKKAKVSLYPSKSMLQIIKSLIGQILSTLDIAAPLKHSIRREMNSLLPKNRIRLPELHAWFIIRRILRSKGVKRLPKHPVKPYHKKILALESRTRKAEREKQEKQKLRKAVIRDEPTTLANISDIDIDLRSASGSDYPIEFQKLLAQHRNISPKVLAEIIQRYEFLRRKYPPQDPLFALLASLVRIDCHKYFGRTVRHLCADWGVSRSAMSQFLKEVRTSNESIDYLSIGLRAQESVYGSC